MEVFIYAPIMQVISLILFVHMKEKYVDIQDTMSSRNITVFT